MTEFQFTQREISLHGDVPAQVLALEPLASHPTDALGLDEGGAVFRVNLESGLCRRVATVQAEQLQLDGTVSLVVSRDHTLAALTSCKSGPGADPFQGGVVVDLESGASIFRLDCGDYQVHHTPFPVTFLERDGKTLLIHATRWDRMDVSDPRTGECLTERDLPDDEVDDDGTEEEIDIPEESAFTEWSGELKLSPDQSRVATIGWAWHPVGQAFSWSVRDWLGGNLFEPDRGASKRVYSYWESFWHGPFFWYDDQTLCIWGDPEESVGDCVPANSAVLYDAASGDLLRSIPGPTMDGFHFDRYLFTGTEDGVADGVAIWNVETGERLHTEPGVPVGVYHAGRREFIDIDGGTWSAWCWSAS